jgi:hypothetical protein
VPPVRIDSCLLCDWLSLLITLVHLLRGDAQHGLKRVTLAQFVRKRRPGSFPRSTLIHSIDMGDVTMIQVRHLCKTKVVLKKNKQRAPSARPVHRFPLSRNGV